MRCIYKVRKMGNFVLSRSLINIEESSKHESIQLISKEFYNFHSRQRNVEASFLKRTHLCFIWVNYANEERTKEIIVSSLLPFWITNCKTLKMVNFYSFPWANSWMSRLSDTIKSIHYNSRQSTQIPWRLEHRNSLL